MLRAAIPLALLLASPAHAEVAATSDHGFVTTAQAEVPGKTPYEVWKALLQPGKWWNPVHSWSGDADNLYLDAQAGGCFCELLPPPKDAPEGTRRGSIEHARILAAMPPRLMRLTGALGPLQGEALTGTLTITLKPDGANTHLTWTYVVGGFMRMKVEDIAPIVDKVLAEQAARLAEFARTPDAAAEPVDPRRRPN
ncbi:MAG: SRPBCC family protein [Sphingomonadales bacterium]|nr:SRPBCC family protein [Sphingomonadales bacterium]